MTLNHIALYTPPAIHPWSHLYATSAEVKVKTNICREIVKVQTCWLVAYMQVLIISDKMYHIPLWEVYH